ncbi:type II toxin-antitoxin system PrlF family antitoxin [Botrimarina sp.]|uniref:type II toxin-antitoxin system PrlF family antitoxin n=1 Tax=Botrimarina sp. TaxID=2795802 RepID=UPI0032EE22A3
MIRSTVTDRWQTTIPSAVRKALDLKPREKLVYEIVDGGVVVRPDRGTLSDLAGAIHTSKRLGSKLDERASAKRSRSSGAD